MDALLRVFHGRPIAPLGVDSKKYLLALDEQMLQQESERSLIEVAARYHHFPSKMLVFFFFSNHLMWDNKNVVQQHCP